MFTHAIVRTPSATLSHGVTSSNLGKPDYALALKQHVAYIEALRACQVQVHVLEADEAYPDACFVEDTAVLAENIAVITRPGALTRRGEEQRLADALRAFYPPDQTAYIISPGTLEGGDVMRVGDRFYVGLSERTNREGLDQFAAHLKARGYTVQAIPLQNVLHLKTGLAYLEDNLLLAAGEFIDHPAFAAFEKIRIPFAEAYAANCIWVNGVVLVPAGYPKTLAAIQSAGRPTLEVDTSEFRKLDGGLSCLSLRL